MRIVHPYEPTDKQAELHGDSTRFKVAVFGRRSGKSTFALNEAIQVCLEKPNSKVWIICPTFAQAKDIYWIGPDMVNKFVLPEYVKRKNDSTLLIEFKTGSILQFKGADRPEVMRGVALDLLISDEIAEHRYAKETWEQILLPALSDKQGQAIFIGTPKGYNFMYELYELGQNENLEVWKSWKVPTWKSGAPWTQTRAGKKELKRLEEQMTEDAYMQEYGADFRKHTGLVFKTFERDVHVQSFEVNATYPLEVGQDFGYTNPTAVLFSYFDNDDTWYIFDEYYASQKPIIEHAGSLMAKRNLYNNKLKSAFGDSEDPQSIAEYAKYDWYLTPAPKPKGSIITGISRIEERMKINAVTGRPKVIIHPRCQNLIYELERYRWKEQKNYELNEADTPEKAYDHLIDAMRYIVLNHRTEQKQEFKPIKSVYTPNF